MSTLKSACVALAAMACAGTMAGSAEAHGPYGPVGMGHMHSMHLGPAHMGRGRIGPARWDHGPWHHHHHGWYGPAFAVGFYEPYYYDSYGDCYRVYRYHHWVTVCD